MSSVRSLMDTAEKEESSGAWIVTFADMMTLILVFFILLYTLSDFEDKAYRNLVSSVQVLDGDGNQPALRYLAADNVRRPDRHQ
jgi:chemotaxis protein MotB